MYVDGDVPDTPPGRYNGGRKAEPSGPLTDAQVGPNVAQIVSKFA
jgi:hypothetical protein